MKRSHLLSFAVALILSLLIVSRAVPQAYGDFAPGGDLSGTSKSQQVVAGAITNAKLANMANSTIKGNFSGSSGAPQDLNPLAVANMLNATFAVTYAATANVLSLSGAQSITINNGNHVVSPVTPATGTTVLLTAQTTTSQNGLWVVQSGAWTRPANFPTGFVIAAQCNVVVIDESTGSRWVLTTTTQLGGSATAVTIDTTSQGWTLEAVEASQTLLGNVFASGSPAQPVATIGSPPTSTQLTNNYCPEVEGTTSSYGIQVIGDVSSNTAGPCAQYDGLTGHLVGYVENSTGASPTVSAGTKDSNCGDQRCTITGLSAATSVTITFANGFNWTPTCVAGASVSLSTPPYPSSLSGTAVTFTFSSLTGTLHTFCF